MNGTKTFRVLVHGASLRFWNGVTLSTSISGLMISLTQNLKSHTKYCFIDYTVKFCLTTLILGKLSFKNLS